MSKDKFSEIILNQYPSFIAKRYSLLQKMRDRDYISPDSCKSIMEAAVHIFETLIRALALFLVSQYLLFSKDDFQDDDLSETLSEYMFFPSSVGRWKEIIVKTMTVYQSRPKQLFFEELHDLFWEMKDGEYCMKQKTLEVYNRMEGHWTDMKQNRPLPDEPKALRHEVEMVMDNLDNFLKLFDFIVDYSVVRIVEKDVEGFQYEDRTGINDQIVEERLLPNLRLRIGWHYIVHRKKPFRLLVLHPLLILLSTPEGLDNGDELSEIEEFHVETTQNHIGFLDHINKYGGFFWDTDNGKVTKDREDLLPTILNSVFFSIEHYKNYKKVFSRLDWDALVKICKEISDDSIGSNKKKYIEDVYLQREEVVNIYENFIHSDKMVLVYTGKSGVGKTNFVLSLVGEDQFTENTCFLLLNGARVSEDIISEINKKFSTKLRSQEEKSEMDNFLEKIRGIPGIFGYKFVLIIDAINENSNAIPLMKNIDEMVQNVRQNQEWFKLIITSRPETWRVIYSAAKPLAENRYFRPGGQDSLDVEVPEFNDIVYKIDRFSRSEVHEAYEKYREKWNITTRFEDVTRSVREAVRDPLLMRLLCQICAKTAVPPTIKTSDIYRNYVNHLIQNRDEKFQQKDIDFLEKEIIPLMVEAEYANEISLQFIQKKDSTLTDRILGMERDSTGNLMSQSFQNLVDADILSIEKAVNVEKMETDYVIRFRFERFYDYYLGMFLSEESKKEKDIPEYYRALSDRVKKKPYLWGALKHALVEYLNSESNNEDNLKLFLFSFMRRAEPHTKELLVIAMVDFYKRKPEVAITSFFNLIAPKEHRRYHLSEEEVKYVKMFVAEAAYRTIEAEQRNIKSYKKLRNRREFQEIFLQTLGDPNDPIRDTGLTILYHMMATLPEFVDELMDALKDDIIKILKPNNLVRMAIKKKSDNRISSFCILSLFFVGRGFIDEKYVNPTARRFGEVLKPLLFPENPILKMLKPKIKSYLIRMLTKEHIKWKQNADTFANYWEIALWLDPERSPCSREETEMLMDFFSPDCPIVEHKNEFIEICRKPNGVIQFFGGKAIAYQYYHADRLSDPTDRDKWRAGLIEILETLCNDEEDNDIAKITALHVLATFILELDTLGSDERQRLKTLYLDTALDFILDNGGWTRIGKPEDIENEITGKMKKQVERLWDNDLLTGYCLVRYEKKSNEIEENGFPIMSEILRQSEKKEMARNMKLICNALSTLGGLGMAERAVDESYQLIEEFIAPMDVKDKTRLSLTELLVVALLQLKGITSLRVENLLDSFDLRDDKYSFLNAVKIKNVEDRTLFYIGNILGNSAYQYAFNNFDAMAENFRHALIEGTKKTCPRDFFDVCHLTLVDWAEKEIRKYML